MSSNNLSDEVILPELYFLIAHFLNNSPFKESARHLIDQLHQFQVLPKRIDWNGNEQPRSFSELLSSNSHIPSNFLLQLCNQLRHLFDSQLAINFSQVNSLLGAGQFSVLQDIRSTEKKFAKTSNLDALPQDLYLNYHTNNRNYFNYCDRKKNGGSNLLLNLERSKIVGRMKTENIIQPEVFKCVNIHKRILGHLSAVYCVKFDRTGKYIITGADDNLIKVWSAYDSRLLATLRGHEKEISDIDINFENTLLASGSCDKSIRIWNLKTTESITVLQGHGNMVTSIEFSPYCRDTRRWLASSGNDGAICFWSWDSKTLVFNPKPRKFIEKSRPGGQMLCISFSSGGSFLAAGSNDHVIRVYFFDEIDGPLKVCELESHTNLVDSIQYANTSAKFLSGSKDGTAKIWHYENMRWKSRQIDASVSLVKNDQSNSPSVLDICKKPTVTMVTWNCSDNVVVTAQNNFLIKVWNANDVRLIHELKGHSDEIFVLEAHPRDPRLLLSAGHDGFVIIWNILSGKLLKKFYNRIENEGHGCLFDTKWSPTADMIAATDSHGYLTIFGFGTDERFKLVPNEQFFHTDYRPLMRDSNDFVVDEQTQQPVHLMQPPFLVNADGNPYDLEYQRLVPGRENLTDAQLNPHVITNENGLPEIVSMDPDEDGRPVEEREARSGDVAPRRGNLYYKNLVSPIDAVTMRTSEDKRLLMRCIEEDYFIDEYRKELKMKEMKSKNSDFLDFDQDSNFSRRRRGKKQKSSYETNGETTIKNRLYTAALFDTDHEDESQKERSRLPSTFDHMEEETMDDQYIDIDDDSNTQHSHMGFASTSNGPNTSSRANNNSRSGPPQATASNYIEPPVDSDSSISSEYSDWAEEDGKRSLKPPPRITPAKTERSNRTERSKRRLKIQDDDEDETVEIGTMEVDDELIINKSKRTNTISKRLRKIVSDDEEELETKQQESNNSSSDDSNEEESSDSGDENELNRPCTSSAAQSRNKKTKRRKPSKNKLANSMTKSRSFNGTSSKKLNDSVLNKSIRTRVKAAKSAQVPVRSVLKECPVEYRPPEWLTSAKPKKSPYVPQIGDEIVYFRQGHELYVKAVQKYKAYELDESSLPWNTHEIGVQEYCKVIGMKVETKPPRLVCLKLGVLEEKTGKQTGLKFSIKYHDMPHVVDFVILRQFYQKAIERNWRPKDRFRSIIDDKWYFGVIESKVPFQEEHPQSHFHSLNVLWDSDDREALSPWDLEVLCSINGRKSKAVALHTVTNEDGIQVTAEEFRDLLYIPESGEWPGVGREYECERILNGLAKIRELSIAEHFNFPVDLDSFPDYAIHIEYPIDLNTIFERLQSLYYRRVNSIQWDVRKIESNASKYNEAKSDIVKKAMLLCEVLLEFINDTDCTNPMPIYKRLERSRNEAQSDLNASNYNTRTRRTTEIFDNSLEINSSYHHRQIKKNKESKMSQNAISASGETRYSRRKIATDAWVQDCKKLIADIYARDDAEVFIEPVDINEAADYFDIIENPICFSEILERLNNNEYMELKDFDNACRLLFHNSKTYNTNKRSKIYIMTQRLNSLYDSRIKVIKANHQAAIEHEALMLSKFKKNRSKIKQKTSSSGKRRILNPNLLSDQYGSPSFQPGISTRSASSKKPSFTSNLNNSQAATTSNLLNKSLIDDEDTSHNTIGGLDEFEDTRDEKMNQSTSFDNLNSIIHGKKKKSHVLESDSDSEYKSAMTNLNSSSKASKMPKAAFKIEPSQNANMCFTSEENCNNTSNDEIPLSFSDILSKPIEHHTSASTSRAVPVKHETNIESTEDEYVSSRSKNSKKLQANKKHLDSESDNDEDEDEFDQEEEDDDDDYEVRGKRSSKSSKNARAKANKECKLTKARSGRKTTTKSLDDKENEDDYEQNSIQEKLIEKSSSSSKLKRNRKSAKRARTSGRSARSRQTTSYKEATSSEHSQTESTQSTQSDESMEKNNSKRNRRNKKKLRRSSSHSSHASPQPKNNRKHTNHTYQDEANSADSDFDQFSNCNSRENSNAGCSSRLSSRGRLLKTVSQY